MKELPTIEYLRECFDHNPATGVLIWKTRPLHHFRGVSQMNACNGRYANSLAGSPNGSGYMQCGVGGKIMQSHRICWALFNGRYPAKFLDHIDRNRVNNGISNLRECTNVENSRNMVRKNSLGFKGVSRSGKRFTAQIKIAMKAIHLGTFSTPEEAHAAYCSAADRLYGAFANYGNNSGTQNCMTTPPTEVPA